MDTIPRQFTHQQLYNVNGTAVPVTPPKVLSASYMRGIYYKGDVRMGVLDDGKGTVDVRYDMVRAQCPYIVTLLMYSSKFQLQADKREYFVYAPMDIKSAVRLAMQLWRRWEKPPKTGLELIGLDMPDLNEDYPKVADGAVCEPIDDNFFDEMWKDVQKRKHRKAGDPTDPFAFTCLDPDVMVYKRENFQRGLDVTI